MKEYTKSGRLAIRLLYFFIISMALTRATALIFTNSSNQFNYPSKESFFLFCVFLTFIIRFCLGAYRVLSEDIEIEFRRWKIIQDSFFLIIQALIFYVYSLTYLSIFDSIKMILFICIVDLSWIIISRKYFQVISKTFSQWVVHDVFFITIGVLTSIYSFLTGYKPLGITTNLLCIAILTIIAIIAIIRDFAISIDFYFAHTTSGLRIFISGPYGDMSDKRTINKNVNIANNIGKEIALKGHFPFIPHTMLHGWESDLRFTRDIFTTIDLQWLEFCDALYFISPSPGANIEKAYAESKGIKIYYSMDDVPNISRN